jgi:hypothetical protein
MAEKKAVNPPILKHASSPHPIRNAPGKVTLYESNMEPREWQQNSGKVGTGLQVLDRKHELIRRFFHNDLFELLAMQQGQMTAFEVGQRVREKLVTISPLVGRVLDEVLTPMLKRCFDIMNQAGVLPPPPEAMGGVADFKIIYNNRVSMALQAIENDGIVQGINILEMLGSAQAAMGKQPDVGDIVNLDKAARSALENMMFPQDAMVNQTQVDEMRAARAQKQQVAEAAALGNQAADTLGKLPEGISKQLAALA